MTKFGQIVSLGKIFVNYKRRRTSLTSLPLRVWIETSSVCNLKCVMCLNRELSPSDKGLMELGLFRKIIDEIRGCAYDVYLHHRGEPLIHPELPEMIEYAKNANLKVRFHTNGTLLKPELSRKLLRAGPDLVSFSIDGFTKEVYEKIRVNADFEETLDNIAYFLRARSEQGLRRPYTVIEEIDFPEYSAGEHEQERRKFAERFRKLGLDEIIFKKRYNWAGYLDVPGGDLGQRTYTMCTFPWYACTIFWDGTISPCPQDYYGKIKLGNVNERPLGKIWNDKEYVTLRKQMLSSVEELSPCNRCDRLYRKRIAGVPFQYLISYLNDNLIGYGRLRKILGSYERNE